MDRQLKTSTKGENENPPKSACIKSSEDMNRIQMVFNHCSERHTPFNPRKFKDPLAHEVMTGVHETEYLIRTGRALQ